MGEMSVSAFDRTLLYGLGAFETVRLFGGAPYLLERHLQRLHRSLAAIGLPVPDHVAAVERGLAELAAANAAPDALARVTVTAGSVTSTRIPKVGKRSGPSSVATNTTSWGAPSRFTTKIVTSSANTVLWAGAMV